MKSTFIKVHIKNPFVDISQMVKSLKFDDTIEEDSMVEIKIRAEHSMRLLEEQGVKRNAIITFQFGFIGDESSPVHTAQIQDIDVRYANEVECTLRCKDMGCNMKKGSSIQIWNGQTREQIVKTIADRYEMEYEVDPSKKVWKNIPQGHKSDFEFLSWLAERETDGNFVFFVRGNKLSFVRRGLNKPSKYTFNYGDAQVISFTPKERETTKDKAAEGVSVAGVDPSNNSVTTADKQKNGISTGDKKYVYNASTAKTGERLDLTKKDVGQKDGVFAQVGKFGANMFSPSSDAEENSNLGNTASKVAGLNGMTADLKLHGDPYCEPNIVLTMGNVARRHSGNWYGVKVTHDIAAEGAYTITIGLKKNGGKVGEANAENVNNTVGTNEKSKIKVKKVYDAQTTALIAERESDTYKAPK